MPTPATRPERRLFVPITAWVNVAVFLAVALALLLAILWRTQRHFSYSLDDPYIHLALAERLRHGLYGLNSGEPSSPSSSVLWPLLLVPFAGTAIFSWVPLAVNLLAGAATAGLLGYFVERYFEPGKRRLSLAIMLVFALNLTGLVFTGLEHSLEVLLCVVAAFAPLAVLQQRPVPRSALIAALLLPSVRYEGLLITFVVAASLWCSRRRQTAALLLPASLVAPAALSLYLHHLKLPWFPLSVLVKSGEKFADHSALPIRILRLIYQSVKLSLGSSERAPELLLVCVLAWQTWRWRAHPRVFLTLAACVAAGAVQVVLGPVGWFYRYEIYCLAFTLMVALAVGATQPQPGPEPTTASLGRLRTVSLPLLLAVGLLAVSYLRAPVFTPQAALTIYEQQAQMGRFASQFYQAPVAVNDLGWVAYDRTPRQYVLDLWGLGSYDAYQHPDHSRAWLQATTLSHGVQLVMVYPDWFTGLPADWIPVAKLCSTAAKSGKGAARPVVVFYATPLAQPSALLSQLRRFQSTLPAGDTLQLSPHDLTSFCTTK